MSLRQNKLLYGVTVFWSAVLLLMIQPMLTKAVLPWFGGSAGVWTSSMLFFQALLLLGYFYAHVLARRLSFRMQATLHLAMLASSLLLMPVHLRESWKPTGQGDPLVGVLGLLATSIGIPYFLLSTTSPLLQSWFAARTQSELPYRLFAISNLGSLAALLCYPALIEPLLSTRNQLLAWSLGYAGFAVFVTACAVPVLKLRIADRPTAVVTRASVWTWIALSACPSLMWIAVANHLSQDVAAVPFLWILPFALYLLTFVLCFDRTRWYRPRLIRWILPISWVALCIAVAQVDLLSFKYTIALFCVALFLCCLFCHGELANRKPPPAELTTFYLSIAIGGALGGLFVGLIAPKVFDEYLELPIALLGCVLLSLWLLYRLPAKRVLRVGGVAGAAVVAALAMRPNSDQLSVHMRNFYGTLQATEHGSPDARYRALYNGTIQHGLQFRSANLSRVATTYYGPASGVAIALKAIRTKPIRVGVVGLGVGTLAALAEPGDTFRFYELNPAVIDVARTHFRYLSESPASVEVIPGDARLSLEREPPQNYDLLILDAFSGDSIPIHLLTREAFALYLRHIRSDGTVVAHVTNKHLDLAPVVKAAANTLGARSLIIHNSKEPERKIYSSSWMIVTRNQELAGRLEYLSSPIPGTPKLWTDDYSNLLGVLK